MVLVGARRGANTEETEDHATGAERTDHLMRFTQEVMRGPSELEPGKRELIAAFVSGKNRCLF